MIEISDELREYLIQVADDEISFLEDGDLCNEWVRFRRMLAERENKVPWWQCNACGEVFAKDAGDTRCPCCGSRDAIEYKQWEAHYTEEPMPEEEKEDETQN